MAPYQRMMASSTEGMPKRQEEEVDLKFDKYYNNYDTKTIANREMSKTEIVQEITYSP